MRKAIPRSPTGLPTALRLLAAVGLPGLATGVASLGGLQSPTAETNAALLYLLSVVVAALIGGLRGGLIASFLSFLGLNFFFTPPLRNFAVAKGEDLLALLVFLAVSILVATLLTRTLSQRSTWGSGSSTWPRRSPASSLSPSGRRCWRSRPAPPGPRRRPAGSGPPSSRRSRTISGRRWPPSKPRRRACSTRLSPSTRCS